jgi:MFS transporter, DHA2 family, multidrug resistance protein
VTASAAGLVALTYDLIKARQDGWSDTGALALMAAGVVILAGFFGWERRLAARPGGQPLLDMSLFTSASFTWGVILAAVAILPLFGAMFTLPQYFQGVLGTKVVVAAGFILFAGGLLLGAATSADSGGAFTATWTAIVGLGTGLTLATASSSAAVAELSQERSGVGSAVFQGANKTGPPLGTAILGSLISAGYLARINLSGVPVPAAAAARQSIFGGVAVARRLGSAALLASARSAFVHGMDTALVVSAVIAAAGLVLAVAFLPNTKPPSKKRPGAGEAQPPTAQIPELTRR